MIPPDMPSKKLALSDQGIDNLIREIRGQKVILDSDLARIYGVSTKAFNQAVKRNLARFPQDFIFRLSKGEAEAVQISRSQTVTLKRGQKLSTCPTLLRSRLCQGDGEPGHGAEQSLSH